MFNRKIIGELRNWASRADRKPLILRGARQVGKTVAVNMFAADFDNYVYLDLQKSENQALFRRNLPIKKILQVIALQQNTDLSIGKCLLFLDEIQDSPEGTAALRYFFEEVPELFVIAAGSLLEIMMEYRRISFPVGRVEYRYLYPIDFTEYLQATGGSVTLQYFNEIPLQSLAHNKILELFHQYTMIGGMPEIVGQFAESHDVMKLRNLYEGLFTTYMNDVSKYALSAATATHLRHAIESAPLEAGKRIVYQGFGGSSYRSREMSESLKTLERAMLVKLIFPTSGTQIPVLPNLKKSPRLQFIDTGLVNYRAGLMPFYYENSDLHAFYKGLIAEHIVYQEIIASDSLSDQKPVFWTRERKQSNAEIDCLLQYRDLLIPVEIKSGKSGTLRSLHQFMDAVDHHYAIRLYAGNIELQKAVTPGGKSFWLLNLPYYLAGKLNDYAAWLIAETEKRS